MKFSDPLNEDGIVQEIDRICGSDDVSYSINAKTARVNQALDRFFNIALMYDKSWSFDDANKFEADTTDELVLRNLPIAVSDLRSGQQDYPFALELLMIHGVFVKDTSGVFHKLEEETDPKNTFLLPSGNGGIPSKFRLIGGSILLDFIPNYNSTAGLKVAFSRNASKFVPEDNDKEPGIPSLFHPWICWVASLPYLISNKLPQKNDIAVLIREKEDPTNRSSIPNFMTNRNRTRKSGMKVKQESNK